MIHDNEVELDAVQDVGECTPLAVPLLDRIVPHGLLRPAVEEASIIDVVKGRLLRSKLRLLCMHCGQWDSVRSVETLSEHVKCPKCNSTLVAATYLSHDSLAKTIQKKKRNQKLT